MTQVRIGNHSAVVVPGHIRDRVRTFYCDVLGCTLSREVDEKDDFLLGDNFYIAVLYGDIAEDSEFLRSGKSIYLELKSDDVETLQEKIIEFGVQVLNVPDPHFYFQAPGGQVFRVVGMDEDLSAYEGGADLTSAPAVVRKTEQSSQRTRRKSQAR